MKKACYAKAAGHGDIACEAEILEEFRALIERALRAGWAEEEVANALVSLSGNFALDLLDEALIEMPASPVLQ